MNDFYYEANELVNKILDGKITQKEAGEQIIELKSKYGKNIFPEIYFEKAPKPWDENYMRKLKDMNIAGAFSEDFVLHMAEVSEYIAKKKKKQKAFIVSGIFIVAVIAALLLGFTFSGKFNRDACLYNDDFSYTVYIGGISNGNFDEC